MRKKKMTLGILAVVIGAVGIVSFGMESGEAFAATGECPAMSANVLPAMMAQCPGLSARMADEAKGRCPAKQDRDEKSACPTQKAKPACPGLEKQGGAKEKRPVDYRKMA